MESFTFLNHINFAIYYGETKLDICELFLLTRETGNLRWSYGYNLLLYFTSNYDLLAQIYLSYTLVCSKLKHEKCPPLENRLERHENGLCSIIICTMNFRMVLMVLTISAEKN